jgi:eukaryotic-like serine/threonine-protein kinase
VLKSSRGVEGIVMPVCGDNFAQIASAARLRNNGPPFSVFSGYLDMCYQVALGIEHMHAKEVVHLDLKESNILLGGDGQVVIADFGLSARVGAKLQLARGTPGYTAPEILQACGQGGAEAGYCAQSSMDVYSAGATFFALMSGTPLTREGNGYEEGYYSNLACIAAREGKADAHFNPDDASCRTWLAMLQECLQQDPEQRPTAAQLRGVLEQLLERVRADEEVLTFHSEFDILVDSCS